MRRLLTASLGLLIVVCISPPPASAQALGPQQVVSVQDSGTECSVASTCAQYAVGTAPSWSFNIVVSGTGTYTFKCSTDGLLFQTCLMNNLSTGALATTTTASGIFSSPNPGIQRVRVVGTAISSGSATVSASAGYLSARLFPLAFPSTVTALCVDNVNQDVCFQRQASGIANLTAGVGGTTFTRINFGTAIASNPAIKANGTILQARLGDDSGPATYQAGTVAASSSFAFGNSSTMMLSATAPIATTFCTGPTVPNNNGTAAFTINVGTGCATSVGTITFAAASTGWVLECHNVTAPATNVVEQTGGTTTTATVTNYVRTTGVAGNWTDSNVLRCKASAY